MFSDILEGVTLSLAALAGLRPGFYMTSALNILVMQFKLYRYLLENVTSSVPSVILYLLKEIHGFLMDF